MRPGTLIAHRYRLDDRIAGGGMGEVWRGFDTRLNRTVAIKLLHAALSGDSRFRARFEQEARSVAALQAPGIVALYDYGEEPSPEGSVSYLIMELVQGRSLADLLHQRGRLSPREVLLIVATAAEALDVAHRAGIIHRDIKPANLLVEESGAVKIVDFGIASARGVAGLTETGTVMGTLSYASPEQLTGSELTGTTDIYSLGVVAFECLAGGPPFASDTPAAMITGHLHQAPPPLPPDVPPPVAQMVLRCLDKDPLRRWASAAELARVCRKGGRGTTATAILPPASPPTRQMASPPLAAPAPVPGDAQPTAPLTALPPEEGESRPRSKTVPILATVTALALLAVVLVVLNPWGEEQDPSQADDGPSIPIAQTSEPDPSETDDDAEEGENTSDEEENTGEEDDADEDQDAEVESADPTTPEAEETETPTALLPDVKGVYLPDAIADLQDLGFIDIVWEHPGRDDWTSDPCAVITQGLSGEGGVGEQTPIDSTIRLGYYTYPDDTNCPATDGSTL